MKIKTIKAIVHHCMQCQPDIEAIYLFGSQEKGFATKDSDVDLAILNSKPLSAELRWELSQSLAVLLHQDVDIVDLKTATTVMQWQVIQTGRRIFTKDAVKMAFFETYVFAEYIRLTEQRQNILNDIKKEGRIYGG